MFSDCKLALRQLVSSPGFAITAILTLALGIGANAVVFSVLNTLILKPLNVPDAANLYTIQIAKSPYPSQSYPDYIDLRDRNRTFSSMIIYQIIGPVGVDTGSHPTIAWPYLTGGNYFDALDQQPYLGRFFHASDEKGLDSAPYVVLSYAYWHSYFHGDPSVIGRSLSINKHPFTILGVARPGFEGTELIFAPDMWIPIVEQKTVTGSNGLLERGDHSPWVIGRLRPGVTPAQATADLNTIGASLARAYPSDDDGIQFSLARPGLVGDLFGGPARAFMTGLMLLAALILLAACANLGSLFAARTSDRAKEVALRLALGSRRRLIVRQLLTEAILVSLAGGILGLTGGLFLLRLLSTWQPLPDIPIHIPVSPDIRTYVVALLLALASGFLFGMVPVRQVLRSDPWQIIRAGMTTEQPRRITLRDLLLVTQIALCAVLITSSLVAVRGLIRSLHSNFGFDPNGVMLVTADLHMSGYSDDDSAPIQRRILDALAAIPGVTSVGSVDHVPLGLDSSDSDVFTDSTTDFRPTSAAADAMNFSILPGYFQTAHTRLIAGRDLAFTDDKNSPTVAVVNRTFALRLFGSVQKAVGNHFKLWGGKRAEIVGVVEDGKYRSLTESSQPAMFFSTQQHTNSGITFLIRSTRDPQEMGPVLESTIHQIDSTLPLTIQPWSLEMHTALFPARVASVALGVLGLLGALLALTGIFGMASYVVSRRMREIGIRVALGASRSQILFAALSRPFRLLALGSVVGILLGLLATKVLASIVYQATPKDPIVLLSVTLTMLLLGMLAALIPARRALAVNPLVLLREE